MRQTRKPVNRVDLVAHPLAEDTRGIGPEQAVFQIFSGIPGLMRTVHQEAFPIGVTFLDGAHQLGTPPATRVIHIPGHLHHHNIAKLTGFNVVIGRNIIAGAATLRSDLHNSVAGFAGLQGGLGIIH